MFSSYTLTGSFCDCWWISMRRENKLLTSIWGH